MISAGRLRHSITYQVQTATDDGYGGKTISWSSVEPSIRANVQPVYAKEQVESMAAQAPYDVKVRHRYTTGINADMRFLFNGDVYEIVGQPINVGMRDRELIVMGRRLGVGA